MNKTIEIRKQLKKSLTKFTKLKLPEKSSHSKLHQVRNKSVLHLKNRLNFLNKKLFFYNSHALLVKNFFNNKIVIRVRNNNFFCTFLNFDVNLKKERVVQADSAGKYKLKTSKKKIKFNLPIVLNTFVRKLGKNKYITRNKQNQASNNVIVKIIAKLRIRRKIVRKFTKFFRGISLYCLQPKKCFNGCRASKSRRKKRLRFRIFK